MRELVQAGDALQRLLQQLRLDRQFRTYDALARWSDIVGKQVAQVARPLRLDADTLWVAVKSHAWAQELNFQKHTILQRLNARAGEERFKEIRFVVRVNLPPALEQASASAQPPVSLPNLSDAERRRVEAMASGITDPALRDALMRAQAATLRYQKFLAQQGWR
ncbi:MAG: DciA family protein, partial [Fimbriimonadales bacterium]